METNGTTMMDRIGPYEVLAIMGQGGTGVVGRCRHMQTGGMAAVKAARDTTRVQRDFLRKEYSMLSRLARIGHPGVVRVLESGSDKDILWYAMEFVDGPDLAAVADAFWSTGTAGSRQRTTTGVSSATEPQTMLAPLGLAVSSGPLAPRFWRPPAPIPSATSERTLPTAQRPQAAGGHLLEALDVVRRIAEVVTFIHGEGVIHGDLKPNNILFRSDGTPVLVDFGTALYALAGEIPREVAQVERLRHGTPGYMAPEQIRGELLDGRCDLYALGCLLFELITGGRPFAAESALSLQKMHLTVPSPLASQLAEDIPPEIDALLGGLLQKDSRQRVGYAQDIVEVLTKCSGVSTHGTRRSASPRHLYRPRMAGRADEIAQLAAALAATRAGTGGVMFVAGESGVGKTRLVNELGGRAVGQHMEVVVGQCSEIPHIFGGAMTVRGAALQPFIPLLHRLFDRCSVKDGERLADSLRAPIAVLAPYEPALWQLATVARERPPELPHALARLRVFRSLAEVIRGISQIRPLLLILDDLHWADDLTLAFLQSRSVRELDGASALIVGTYRTEQVEDGLRTAVESHPERLITLNRLGIDSIRSMANDMLAALLCPEGMVQSLYDNSEGNPLFAAEYLRAVISRGLLVRNAAGAWRVPPLSTRAPGPDQGAGMPLPASLQGLLEMRMAGVSPAAESLLELAAVLGREFHVSILEAFRDGLETPLMGADLVALDELVARQILEESGPGRYRFVHDKLREAREQAIPLARRRLLHASAARRLAAATVSPADRARYQAQIGSHWAYAGEPGIALPFLELAARGADAVYDNTQALALYRLALTQAELVAADIEGAGAGKHTICELGEALGDLQVRMARHSDARASYDRALSAACDNSSLRLCRARILRKKGQSFWTVHQYTEAALALKAARAVLGEPTALDSTAEHQEWIEIQLGDFWRNYFARQTGPTTESMIRELAATVEEQGTILQRSNYYICAALDILGRHRYATSPDIIAFMRKAAAVLDRAQPLEAELGHALFNLGFALVLAQRSDIEEGLAHLEQTAERASRIGDATLLARSLIYQAVGHRRRGDVVKTSFSAERALRAAEDAHLPPYIGAAVASLGWVHLRDGRWEAARAACLDARSWWMKGDHAFPFRWLATLPLLAITAQNGAVTEARELVVDLLDTQQQALPDRLDAALKATSSLPPETSPDNQLEALATIIAIAREMNYI